MENSSGLSFAEWFSYVASITLALSSIAVPCITTWLNNKFQLELTKQNQKHELETKKTEIFSKSMCDFINQYIDNLITYVQTPNEQNLQAYKNSFYKVIPYLPDSASESLYFLDEEIKSYTGSIWHLAVFHNVLKELSKCTHPQT